MHLLLFIDPTWANDAVRGPSSASATFMSPSAVHHKKLWTNSKDLSALEYLGMPVIFLAWHFLSRVPQQHHFSSWGAIVRVQQQIVMAFAKTCRSLLALQSQLWRIQTETYLKFEGSTKNPLRGGKCPQRQQKPSYGAYMCLLQVVMTQTCTEYWFGSQVIPSFASPPHCVGFYKLLTCFHHTQSSCDAHVMVHEEPLLLLTHVKMCIRFYDSR